MSPFLRRTVVPFLSQLGQALAASVPGFHDPDLFTGGDGDGASAAALVPRDGGSGVEAAPVAR